MESLPSSAQMYPSPPLPHTPTHTHTPFFKICFRNLSFFLAGSENFIDTVPCWCQVWSAVLGVGLEKGNVPKYFREWEEDATSNQIATDLPRCHPYNLTLASDEVTTPATPPANTPISLLAGPVSSALRFNVLGKVNCFFGFQVLPAVG